MKLKNFDFRIWDGKKYLKQKIYNDNINDNEYIAVTGNVDDENYVFTIKHGCERDYYSGDYDEYCKIKDFTSCNYEIELWTGLYDKNGKKIYENDIITLCHFAQKCIGVVRFGRNGFVITSKDENAEQGGELSYFEKYFYNFEVVGNIHENHI